MNLAQKIVNALNKVVFGALLVLSVSSMVHGGCATPKVGNKCETGEAYCAGSAYCLSCKDGALARYECNGPKGCARNEERDILCDQSGGTAPGTPCFPVYEGKGQCASDSPHVLQCVQGRWSLIACPSGQQCEDKGGSISCVSVPLDGGPAP